MAAPGQVLRSTQAERWSLGDSRRSARLGSARLGSARLGSALMMRANGPGRFCQVFLRVIHNFSPSVPFRAGNRAPPPPEDVLWAPWARSIRRAQAPRFPLSMPLSVGSVKALPAVFSGALLAVFK